jgi:hypothetical protein
MKRLLLITAIAAGVASLTGCETTADVLQGVASEMERQQPQQRSQYPRTPQQPQQAPVRRPGNASAGGIK